MMLLPLLFVVFVNGVKDFCEDYKRKQSDNRENKTKCISVKTNPVNGEINSAIVAWEELGPGDIVKVRKNEYFPADLLVIYSTNKNGVAYVETKNLDGETNLKYKESVKNTYRLMKHFKLEEERDSIAVRTFGTITCDNPNAHMYEFEGFYNYENRVSQSKIENIVKETSFSNEAITNNSNSMCLERRLSKIEEEEDKIDDNANNAINLDYNNIVLRGSSLRNTDYIYGIVVYAGHNTKIMLNSLNARNKQSKVFRIMNSQLKLILLFQFIASLCFSIFYTIDPDPYVGIWYQDEGEDTILINFIYSFFAWILTTCNIVPISLLVTLEMIKFCQAIFIKWDFHMYDKENKRPAIVQTSALNEELGQVHVRIYHLI